jgi:hypothetical protein
MTEQIFWDSIKKFLDVPFDIENVVKVECDPTGCIYLDLIDGSTFYLAFNEAENIDDWD